MIHLRKRSKYGNRRTVVNGITFDSNREAERWGELLLLQRKGDICDLKRQVPFDLKINGARICKYLADFTYMRLSNKCYGGAYQTLVVEDVKGCITRVYAMKKKLMKAIYGIEIKEV